MNLKTLKAIVAELHALKAEDNPEIIFEIDYDQNSDLIVDWQNNEAKSLIINLAHELELDYKSDFKIGHTRAENLPARFSNLANIKNYLRSVLNDYINVADKYIL